MSEVSIKIKKAYVQTAEDGSFSASEWLAYFNENRDARSAVHFPQDIAIDTTLKAHLLHSLQRFQLGETGDGKHLKAYAKSLNDPDYEKCIELFVQEEQSHARLLAEMIAALDGTLITSHWTDIAFTFLRRALRLKTELFVLLIAEAIGKCFYLQCARQVKNRSLSNGFSLITLDEIAHIEFICDFLRSRLQRLPAPGRMLVYWGWAMLFYAACFVFVFDHRKTLAALEITPSKFVRDCSTSFHRAAGRVLST